jgi:hypothetical protein
MWASIATVHQDDKINNFAAFENGTGAHLTGQIAPNQELHSLPTWLENPFEFLQKSAINLIPDLLNSGIFIRILFFRL